MPRAASRSGVTGPGPGLFAAVSIDALGGGLWLPFALIFFTRGRGVGIGAAGVALTVGSLVGLAVGQFSGRVLDSERFGPHRALVTSSLVRAATFSVYPLVSGAVQVAVVVAVTSAADRVFWTANYPYLSSFVQGREVDRLFGTITVVQVAGFGVGAAAAGLFADNPAALNGLAWLNAGSFAVSGVLLWRQPSRPRARSAQAGDAPDRHPVPRARAVWRDRPYLLLCGVQILLVLMVSSFVVVLPLVIVDTLAGPTWLVGAGVVVASTVLAVAQKPVLRGVRTRPRRQAVLTALPLYGVAFLVLASVTRGTGTAALVTAVLIAAILEGLAESLSIAIMLSAASDAAPAGAEGRYSAAFQTSWGLAEVIAPLLFTRLLLVGTGTLWLTLAGVAVVTAPVVLRATRQLPPRVFADVAR